MKYPSIYRNAYLYDILKLLFKIKNRKLFSHSYNNDYPAKMYKLKQIKTK